MCQRQPRTKAKRMWHRWPKPKRTQQRRPRVMAKRMSQGTPKQKGKRTQQGKPGQREGEHHSKRAEARRMQEE